MAQTASRRIADLEEPVAQLRRFAGERDWEAFHTLKNHAPGLIVEAAELLERFQWLTSEQSRILPPVARNEVAREIADGLIYLTCLADQLGIDPLAAVAEKMALNAQKYTVSGQR